MKSNKITALADKYSPASNKTTNQEVFLRRYDPDTINSIRALAQPYYFVQNEAKFYEYNKTAGWLKYGVATLRSHPLLNSKPNWQLFTGLIEFEGRSYKGAISTFNKKADPSLLNLMRTDEWLSPTPGDVDPRFNKIVRLIGSHVIKAIATKYSRPHVSQCPIILFSPNGDEVPEVLIGLLSTIFNRSFNRIIGSSVKVNHFTNRAVILLDNRDKLDEVLYSPLIGQSDMGIGPIIENTALYIVLMDHKEAVSYYRSPNGPKGIYCPINRIDQPIDDLIGLCGNHIEVAKFLNRIIETEEKRPAPWCSDEFLVLLNSNRINLEDFFRWLIGSRVKCGWRYASFPDIWTIFCEYRDTLGVDFGPINKTRLRFAIIEFFQANRTELTWRDQYTVLGRKLIGPSGGVSTFDGLGLRGEQQFNCQASILLHRKGLTMLLLQNRSGPNRTEEVGANTVNSIT